MNEMWSRPRKQGGPLPSGHLVVDVGVSRASIPISMVCRCGKRSAVTPLQVGTFTPEPPVPSDGPSCEHCLRLANRDRRLPEDDGSTHGESVP